MLINRLNTVIGGNFASQNRRRKQHLALPTTLFFVALFLILATLLTGAKRVFAEENLTITLTSSEEIEFNIIPNTFGSGSVSFNTGTTDNSGYTVYLKTTGLNLINQTRTSSPIVPISLPSGNTTGILSTDFGIDTFGYSMDGNLYKPLTEVATINGQGIAQTSEAGSNDFTITYGVRTGINTIPGEYNLAVEILAVVNQHSYSITYDSNTTDRTLANMPSINPDEGLTNVGDPINLSSTIPTRRDWIFLGWDTSKTATTPAYTAGSQIIPDFSSEASFITTLYAIWEPKTYNVIFHSNYIAAGASAEDNSAMPTATMPVPTNANLPKNQFTRTDYSFLHWNTMPDGSGDIYVDKALVRGLAAANTNFDLYAIWIDDVADFEYDGTCTFDNSSSTITGGECLDYDTGLGYIDTGIMPFTDENVDRNFDMKFTVGNDLDLATIFDGDYGGTLVNSVYEVDSSGIYFPGFVVRIRNHKIQFQARTGYKSQNAIILNYEPEDILGKQIRIFRHHAAGHNILYLQIGDDAPIRFADITGLVSTFNTPITIGASVYPESSEILRPLSGSVNDFSFEYLEDGLTYDEIAYGNGYQPPVNDDMEVVFSADGPCTFNGNNVNMTGDNCDSNGPTNGKFINTGINLFDQTNVDKDFIIDVDVGSDYGAQTQPENQVTIIGSEYPANGYPGFAARRNGTKIEVKGGQRTGQKGTGTSTYVASEITHISVMRRGGVVCYSFNHDPYQLMWDYAGNGFNNYFAQPVYFGGASKNTDLQNPTSQRTIKGTLSNMKIQLGTINPESNDCKFD